MVVHNDTFSSLTLLSVIMIFHVSVTTSGRQYGIGHQRLIAIALFFGLEPAAPAFHINSKHKIVQIGPCGKVIVKNVSF